MKENKHRLGNAETPTLCPTKVLNELSLYKNYDKISFRLPLPLKKWVKSQGGSKYIRKLILEDLQRRTLQETHGDDNA